MNVLDFDGAFRVVAPRGAVFDFDTGGGGEGSDPPPPPDPSGFPMRFLHPRTE